MTNYILLFQTTHSVIKTERLCKAAHIPCTTIPVPRTFTTECGIGLEISGNVLDSIKGILADNHITARIHVYVQ
jgi:hypothetical protein